MKIIIELPTNILDSDQLDSLSFIKETVRDEVAKRVKEQLVDIYLQERPDFSDLEITEQEIKDAILDRIAETYMERHD